MARFRRHPAMVSSLSLVLLVVYVVASLGLLPSPRVIAGWFGRVAGDRYPCESCGCGCASAGECWTQCCCHSEHERLVWAIENGVMPPPIVEFTDDQWIAAANAVRPDSAHCMMCVARIQGELRRGIPTRRPFDPHSICGAPQAEKTTKSCCAERRIAGQPQTCHQAGTTCQHAGSAAACGQPDSAKKTRWPGPSMSALSCKGLSQLLISTLPPTPPANAIEIIVPAPSPMVPERPRDATCASLALEVPKPPPRA